MVKQKFIRTIILFLFVQLLIFVAFVFIFNSSKPLDLQNKKNTEVLVEKTEYFNFREPRFYIYSNSEKYYFPNRGVLGQYSNYELYQTISVGDKLSLTYVEQNSIFNDKKVVIEASSEMKTYFTIEEFQQLYSGTEVFIVIVFSVLEIGYISIVSVYCWFHKDVFIKYKCKLRKTKKL